MLVASVSRLRVAICPMPKHHLWAGGHARALCGRELPAGVTFHPLTAWDALIPSIRCARCHAVLQRLRSTGKTERGNPQ